MKRFATLAFALAASGAWCQMGPPPGRPGQGGPPPANGGMGQGRNSGGGQGNRPNQATQATVTETIRLLSMAKVQNELRLDARQYAALSSVARAGQVASWTEEQAFAAVAKALTSAQATRLTELLVQDLGYGSLALSRVRANLDLTPEGTTAVLALTASLDGARKEGASPEALKNLKARTDAALAKLLTAEQDAKLRSLAGKSL